MQKKRPKPGPPSTRSPPVAPPRPDFLSPVAIPKSQALQHLADRAQLVLRKARPPALPSTLPQKTLQLNQFSTGCMAMMPQAGWLATKPPDKATAACSNRAPATPQQNQTLPTLAEGTPPPSTTSLALLSNPPVSSCAGPAPVSEPCSRPAVKSGHTVNFADTQPPSKAAAPTACKGPSPAVAPVPGILKNGKPKKTPEQLRELKDLHQAVEKITCSGGEVYACMYVCQSCLRVKFECMHRVLHVGSFGRQSYLRATMSAKPRTWTSKGPVRMHATLRASNFYVCPCMQADKWVLQQRACRSCVTVCAGCEMQCAFGKDGAVPEVSGVWQRLVPESWLYAYMHVRVCCMQQHDCPMRYVYTWCGVS